MFKKNVGTKNYGSSKSNSRLDKWWIVVLRKWILLPLFFLLIIPIKILMESRKNTRYFLLASFILKDSGAVKRKGYVSFFEKKIIKRYGSIPKRYKILFFLKSIFWMPRLAPFDAELSLGRRLFIFTAISYVFFIFFLSSAAIYAYENNTFLDLIKELYSLVFDGGDLYSTLFSGQTQTRDFIFSLFFWGLSVINAVILYARPYKKKSDGFKSFFIGLKILSVENNKFDDRNRPFIDDKTKIIALEDMIFISSPTLSVSKLKDHPYGWPGGFLPGEIVENIKNPSEIVIIRREERDPIVFGGDFSSTQILDHLEAYDKKIVKVLKDERDVKNKPELLFLGEVIDSAWWKSSQIYVPLNTNPHITITGQTRSGKTKGLLSLVYSFARAYPETTWFFADGKGSPDYVPFADKLSAFPLAKPDENGDPLIQLANVIDAVWGIYTQRRNLFTIAQHNGKSCSTIFEYRSKVGPMEHVFLVIDEFAVFVGFMDFENNWKKDDTLANRIKRLLAESASYGIHLILATQRYQNTDLPPVIRTNLTARLVYNVNQADADYLKLEHANKLKAGQSYAQAQGLYCEHTGLNTVKLKLPYVGDSPSELLEKTLKQFPEDKKKQFDPYLTYTKGDDDIENMSIASFCMKLYKFFRDQNYVSDIKEQDFESTDLQMEVRKAKRFKRKQKDSEGQFLNNGYGEDLLDDNEELDIINNLKKSSKNSNLDFTKYTEVDGELLVARKDQPPIGISVMRTEEIDEDSLLSMQSRYKEYKVIIIFALGKNQNSQKYKFVDGLNERGNTRFVIYALKDYRRDFRYVENKRKNSEGNFDFDIINEKINKLGNNNIVDSGDASQIKWTDLNDKTPIKTKVQKVFESHGLKITDADLARRIPFVKTILPGGTDFYIFIVNDKDKKEDVKLTAIEESENGSAVAIIIDAVFTTAEKKLMKEYNIIAWRFSEIEDWISKCQKMGKIDDFVKKLLKDSGVVNEDTGQVRFGNNAKVTIKCEGNVDENNFIPMVKIYCDLTNNYNIVNFSKTPIESYRLDYLGLTSDAFITLASGVAPLNTNKSKLKIKPKALIYDIKSKNFETKNGILTRKSSKIEEDDPFLSDMMDEDD